MEGDEGYDWLSFFLNFIFAATPTWVLVGLLVWRYSPYTEGSTVLFIASIASIVVGVTAGIWRVGFWNSATKLASISPYARRKK